MENDDAAARNAVPAPIVCRNRAAELGVLIASASQEDLMAGGRRFLETVHNSAECLDLFGCNGRYQMPTDGDLIEWLWNRRDELAALYDLAARRPVDGPGDIGFIWSEEHGAYWRPDDAGYTVRFSAAGLYPRGYFDSMSEALRKDKRLTFEPLPEHLRKGL